MKPKYLIFIYALSLLILSCKSEKKENDIIDFGLNGKVKSVIETDIRQHGSELASCIANFGEFHYFVFYAVDDFFVEEIYDMNLQCLIEINIISEKEIYDKYVEKSLL